MSAEELNEVDELRRQRDDARDALENALRGSLFCDTCDAQLQREACGRVRTCSRCRAGNLIAEEILQEIERGRQGTLGERGSIYSPQISVTSIEQWRERLNPKPTPMCKEGS